MKGWRTAYIFRLRGSVLLTGTASGVRSAQETSVTNGAAGAVPVRTCRVFQAWVSLGEPSADPLSTWGKQFCSIALTYIMSPVFRIENFPGSVPPALGPYCEFGSLRRLLPPTVPISDQESRSNFVWLAPLRIYYMSTQRIVYTREVASSNRTAPVSRGISNRIDGWEVN